MTHTEAVPSKIFSDEELMAELRGMITPDGLQASRNELFRSAVFGRDSIWTARFLIDNPDNKEVVRLALLSLARTQGTQYVPRRAEEPGKIAHECRRGGDPTSNKQTLEMFERVFGEAAPGLYLVYTTVDATPLWAVLLGEYCERYGREILAERVEHISGEELSVFDVLMRAAHWVEQSIRRSDLGLLEAVREDREGHAEFHVLRDGRTSYRHEDGRYPNLKRPIAYLEVQGYAYDALRYAAAIARHLQPRKAFEWRNLAKRVQARTLELFWQSDIGTFAAALDRDPKTGEMRPLRMLSTIQPEILGTGIFDGLGETERARYFTGVLKNFFTPELQTLAGPRAVSLRYDHLTPYYAYQWSRTVWPVLSHLVARGLKRQGFGALAYDLSARMVNTVHAAGSPREFFYVTPQELVAYDPEGAYMEGEAEEISATNCGEAQQTWTIAAVLEAKCMLKKRPAPAPLERELLGREVAGLLELPELQTMFKSRMRIKINMERAREMEHALITESMRERS